MKREGKLKKKKRVKKIKMMEKEVKKQGV